MHVINRIVFILLFLGIFSFSYAQPKGSLLVANKADNNVSIFDVATRKEIIRIPVGEAPHELAVSPDGKTAVVCNYGVGGKPGNTLSVIDIPGKKNVKTIDLGTYTRPHGIEFINDNEVVVTSEATKNLIKVHTGSGSVSLVAFTDQASSHMVAWSPSDQMAYVANITPGTVSAISATENKVTKLVSLKKGIEGIAVSPDGKEVWVANRDEANVTALNTANWETIAVMPADKVAYRVKFLANGKYALVSNGMAGNVNVYDVKNKTMIRTIDFMTLSGQSASGKTDQPVPGGIISSSDSKYVFVASTGYNLAVMIDASAWNISGVFITGNVPDGIYYSQVTVNK